MKHANKKNFFDFFYKKTEGWYSNQSFLFKVTWNIWEILKKKYIWQCIVFFLDHTNMPNVHQMFMKLTELLKNKFPILCTIFSGKLKQNWKIMLFNSKNSIILFFFLQDFLNGQFVLIEVVKSSKLNNSAQYQIICLFKI